MVNRRKRSPAQGLQPLQREAFWRSHIAGWKTSGQTKRTYCQENNIGTSSFHYWLDAITEKDEKENSRFIPKANPFKKLELINMPPAPGVEEPPTEQLIPGATDLVAARQALAPECQSTEPQLTTSCTRTSVEFSFPGGIVLRTDDTCQVSFLTEIFAKIKEQ